MAVSRDHGQKAPGATGSDATESIRLLFREKTLCYDPAKRRDSDAHLRCRCGAPSRRKAETQDAGR